MAISKRYYHERRLDPPYGVHIYDVKEGGAAGEIGRGKRYPVVDIYDVALIEPILEFLNGREDDRRSKEKDGGRTRIS